jgi:hypothetical protein
LGLSRWRSLAASIAATSSYVSGSRSCADTPRLEALLAELDAEEDAATKAKKKRVAKDKKRREGRKKTTQQATQLVRPQQSREENNGSNGQEYIMLKLAPGFTYPGGFARNVVYW